jgi:hypothetical protein
MQNQRFPNAPSAVVPSLTRRVRTPHRSSGRAMAKVLLVLSAIFLLVGVVGAFVARSAFTNELLPAVTKMADRLKVEAADGAIVVPGEKKMTLAEAGGIAFGAFEKTELDGTTYTFAPAGDLSITITGPDGQPVRMDKAQGMQPIDMKENGVLHPLGFAEAKLPGEYTITTAGQSTAVYGLAISTSELEAITAPAMRAFGGAAAGCCGIPLFLLFGIIGGILLIFGKKPTPMP